MIAALPMYNQPDCLAALGRYWALIRDGLRDGGVAAPDELSWGVHDFHAHWLDPALVLSQACGYPFRAVLQGKVTLIGTPDYGVAGCAPGYYRSVLVVRADDDRDDLTAYQAAMFAYNDPMSQSGWAAAQTHAQRHGFQFDNTAQTGGHVASAHAVKDGSADIAAIDAVTWRLLLRNDPALSALRVLAETDPTPGLPYIAAQGADRHATFRAIAAAISGLAPQDRDTLGIRGIVDIPASAYLGVPTPAPAFQSAH